MALFRRGDLIKAVLLYFLWPTCSQLNQPLDKM